MQANRVGCNVDEWRKENECTGINSNRNMTNILLRDDLFIAAASRRGGCQ